MDEDLKLPEDDEVNLNLDDLPAGDPVFAEAESTDTANISEDFNLDEFLAENAVEEPSDEGLNLPQDDINLDGLFADETPVSSELQPEEAKTGEAAPEASVSEFEAEPEIEPVAEIEPETEVEPEPEPENWSAEVEDVSSEEAVLAGEDIAEQSEGEAETPSKGWAFDGLDADAPVEEDVVSEDMAPQETVAPDVVSEESFYEQAEADSYPAVEEGVAAAGYDMVSEPNFVKWYSGDSGEEAFELDRNSASEVLQGDESRRVIHINVGYDTYGWQVRFADNTVMNLRDVREYQLRNGSLPAADGMVIYGEMQTQFYGIEKITIYESVRYFTYG